MPLVNTSQLVPGKVHPQEQQVYNALDCCLTLEILGELQHLFNEEPLAYNFTRALQGPALEMMLRGWRVDEYERRKSVERLREEIARVDAILQRYADAIWSAPLNPRSTQQLQRFFYGAMKIPEVWISQKGVKKLSMNREVLEKLEVYFYARPIIACIMVIRDLEKQLEVYETEIDSDGRMRTSYNIAGTETWRFSSSKSSEGTGRNLQNIEQQLRKMFIADPGWKLCAIDLEQAESREVGWLCGTLFNDWSYLDACESGDLHTLACKLIWPGLGWTGDPKLDRAMADQIYYREFSYRDMSKRGGHGSNYYGTPWTMARHLKVPVKLMEDFQSAYFAAFPAIPKYHRWVAEQIQTTYSITTPFGLTRHFFGRPNDDTTLRKAIAFSPQSSTAVRLNLGLWRVWHYMPQVRILHQEHDALYFQYRIEDDEAAIIARALELIRVELRHGDRRFVIPGEAKVGWNRGSFHERLNPDGLMKWKGHDARSRSALLDRVL